MWGETKQICTRLWRKEIVRLVLGMAWLGLICIYGGVLVAVNKYRCEHKRWIEEHKSGQREIIVDVGVVEYGMSHVVRCESGVWS